MERFYCLVLKTQKFIFVMSMTNFVFSLIRWKLIFSSLPFSSVHPVLKLTLEKENNFSLPFLYLLFRETTACFLTSIYRKPTGLYTRWDSFCPNKGKNNLIKSLTYRILMICFVSMLDEVIKFITRTLGNNGFLLDLVWCVNLIKISNFNKIKPFFTQKMSYLFTHLSIF